MVCVSAAGFKASLRIIPFQIVNYLPVKVFLAGLISGSNSKEYSLLVTVGGRDADTERTRTYLQRVSCEGYSLLLCQLVIKI